MRILTFILPLLTLNAQARWLSKSEAGSVMERFHIDYQVFKDGSWTQTIDYAVRVQSEDAKVSVSVFPIDYNAFTDQVELIEAYTLNGKTRINVDPKAIEDRDKGESKDYDVMRTKTVVFPQVQIGSRIFVKYKVKTTKPTILERFSTEINLQPSYFVDDFRLTLNSEMPLSFEVKDPRKLVRVFQFSPQRIEVKNRSALPGWVTGEKDPYFHPSGTTEFRVSSHTDWNSFMSSLSADYEKILETGSPKGLKAWVEQAKKKSSDIERIQFILEKMSVEFRYFGDWRRHNGGLVPRPLDEIEKSRYGDCKDLSTLLTSILRDLGMKANVALVRRGENPWGEEPDYKLPGVSRFNHAITYVEVNGQEYWLDPTNPVASLRPFPDIAGRPAWLLGKAADKFARLPVLKAQDFEHVHEYEYRFRDDEKVSVNVKAQLNKLAPYEIATDLMLAPKPDVLQDTLEYFSEEQEVKSSKFIKEPQTGRILADMSVDLQYETGRVAFTAGKSSFWVIPDGFLQGAFYETEERESDLRISDDPFVFRGLRRLKDTRLAQETPEFCKIESVWMNIDRDVRVDGTDVVIAQNIELLKPIVTRAEFRSPAFKKLQAETKRCFYRSGVLIESIHKGTLSNNED